MHSELDLTSVYAKLGRAKEHFETVDSKIDAWTKSGEDTFTVERGAYNTRIGLAIHFHAPHPDFLGWTLIIADCIHNLRCALDHLVYVVGKFETRENPTTDVEKNYFVIADTEPEFRGESKGKLRGLNCHIIRAIERVQPYNRRHPIIPPLLTILRRFNNADKHRLLQMAGAGIGVSKILCVGDSERGRKLVRINPEPVQDNDIVCVIESTEPDPQFALNEAIAGVEVALWHGLRDGETNPLAAHTGYSVLMPLIIKEVEFVIEQVVAALV